MSKSVTGLIRPYQHEFHILSKLLDAVCIIGNLWLLCLIYDRFWDNQALAAILAVGLFHLFGEIDKVYRSWRSESLIQEFISVCAVWFAVVFVLLLLGYITKTTAQYSRIVTVTWFVITPLILCLWRSGVRLGLRFFRTRGYNTRTVAIAGASHIGLRVAETINQSPWMGLRLVGFFEDRAPLDKRTSWRGPIEGNFEALLNCARTRKIDVIYIALPLEAKNRIQQLLDKLSDTTISVYVVPEIFLLDLFHSRWVNLGTLPIISVFETPFYGLNGWLKRLQDMIFASVILFMITIPMILIAIGIKLSSPGPVLFKQKRYGLDGREIAVWKFRTMRVCENESTVPQATRSDPRVTRFGAFLRRTSLDELPQFINVLQGNMSIVGPRPHAIVHNETYRSLIKGYMLRHKVKPGITGWAQINGWRGETKTIDKMEQRVKHDLWYIHNWSLRLDLMIILLTMLRGFSGKHVY